LALLGFDCQAANRPLIALSSVAAAMSFWLARGGASGLSTLKSALMRSRTCLPCSRARSPRAEASPAIEARSSRTVRYSSASLASSREPGLAVRQHRPQQGCSAPQPSAE
jgi:hypothetical protein